MSPPISTPASDCYVLRLDEELRHGALAVIRLWAPEALGYVLALEQAGVYTAETIAGESWRYNDGRSAAAVPCMLVEAVAVKVRVERGEVHVLPKRELTRIVRAAARVADYRASRAPKPPKAGAS